MKNSVLKIIWSFWSIIILLSIFCSSSAAETLYVFFPTEARPLTLQSQLQKSHPDLDITVFGKYRDLSSKIRQTPPDAILSKEAVIKTFSGYLLKLTGTRNDSVKEAYVLITIGKGLDFNDLSGATIGVIDILGRKGMKKYIGKYFTPVPKMKRVTKPDDLLPLLTFEMAQGLLITESQVEYLKKISKQKFIITPVPEMQTDIISLGVKEGSNTEVIVESVFTFIEADNQLLEVDGWK